MARDLELPISAPGAALTEKAIGRVAGQVDNLGDEAVQAARKVDKLNDELRQTDARIKQLAATYAETGDRQIFKQLRKERGVLGDLKKVAATLKPPVPPGGGGLGGMVTGLFSRSIASPLVPAIAGAIVIGSPVIGAAMGAALLTGVGSAGLGAGIASAIRQDEQVRNEFRALGEDLVDVFDEAGRPFVEPLRQAARLLRGELRGVREEWVGGIGGMADLVDPLARGLGGLFRDMSPGFLRALEASKPVIETLAAKLPGLGEDLSSMFDSFADAGPGATAFMDHFLNWVGGVAVGVGEVTEALSKAYDFLDRTNAFITFENPPDKFIKGIGDVGDAADEAAGGIDHMRRSVEDLMGQFMTLDELEIRVAAGFDEVRESIEEHGRSLDINSEKGRANRDALLGQIDALIDQRQEMIDSGMAVGLANDIYSRNVEQLIKMASSLGVSRKALLEFLGPYNQLQSKDVVLRIKAVTSLPGGGAAFRTSGGVTFMSGGGPIEGNGPRGVDSQLVMAAPGEYMLDTRMVDQAGGVAALERWRKGSGNPYMSTAASAGGGGGGGTRTLQPVQLVVDGRILHEILIDLSVRRGQTPAQLWPDVR